MADEGKAEFSDSGFSASGHYFALRAQSAACANQREEAERLIDLAYKAFDRAVTLGEISYDEEYWLYSCNEHTISENFWNCLRRILPSTEKNENP